MASVTFRCTERLYQAQGGACAACSVAMLLVESPLGPRSSRQATLEHLLPRAFGGTSAMSNLAATCERCNSTRGLIEWRAFLGLVRSTPPEKLKSICKRLNEDIHKLNRAQFEERRRLGREYHAACVRQQRKRFADLMTELDRRTQVGYRHSPETARTILARAREHQVGRETQRSIATLADVWPR